MPKKKEKDERIKKLAIFLIELRALKFIPRASFCYLKGPIKENIIEHCFFTTLIGWTLAKLEGADEDKVIKMCLLHDMAETRGGERSLINKFYAQTLDELRIVKEISKADNLEDFEIVPIFKEFWGQKTKEAQLAQDADILSQMMWEKECLDIGNKKAQKWIDFSLSRLKTKSGKKLGKIVKETDSDDWWMEIVKKYILKVKFL